MWKLAATPSVIAIGCLLPVSSWWFMQLSSLLGTNSPAIGNISLQALQALLLVQLVVVSLFSPQWAVESNEQSTQRFAFVRVAASVISSVLPAWPLLAMLSLATAVSATELATAEAMVLTTGFSVAFIAHVFQGLGLGAEVTRLSQIFLGLVAATVVWVFRLDWFHWIGL